VLPQPPGPQHTSRLLLPRQRRLLLALLLLLPLVLRWCRWGILQ
jgi:hypothetical protein